MALTPHPDDVVNRLTVLELAAADIETHQSPRPVDFPDGARRQQHLVAGAPLARVDPDIANEPVGILDQQLLDMADHAIEQVNTMSDDRFDASQMEIA
jgi:hypothetical protein